MNTLIIALFLAGLLIAYGLGWWWGFKYGSDSMAVVMLNLEAKMKALPPEVLAEIEKSRDKARRLPPATIGALRRGKSERELLHEDPTYRALMEAQKAKNGKGG